MSAKRHYCGWADQATITVGGHNWNWGWKPGVGRTHREYQRARFWWSTSQEARGRKRIRARRLEKAYNWYWNAWRAWQKIQAGARSAFNG